MKNAFILVVSLFISTAHADVINAFSADYDISNWIQSPDGGSIDTSLAPNSVSLTSADGQQVATEANTNLTIEVTSDGTISFDWLYNTTDDPAADPFGWLLNGAFNLLSDINSFNGSSDGSEAFEVSQGDIFGFNINSFDSQFGAATAVISNFKFTSEVPAPSTIVFFALACGFIAYSRKKMKA